MRNVRHTLHWTLRHLPHDPHDRYHYMLSALKPRSSIPRHLTRPATMTQSQKIYIVTAIHCPSTAGMNPNCYSITGAYSSASAAQAAMKAKAKELFQSPLTHRHGHNHGAKESPEPEWKEGPFKIEFKGEAGDVGVCWVDERVLGVEDMPITQTLKPGRFGAVVRQDDDEDEDEEWNNTKEAESTLVSLLKF